jgi:hypothetical protein
VGADGTNTIWSALVEVCVGKCFAEVVHPASIIHAEVLGYCFSSNARCLKHNVLEQRAVGHVAPGIGEKNTIFMHCNVVDASDLYSPLETMVPLNHSKDSKDVKIGDSLCQAGPIVIGCFNIIEVWDLVALDSRKRGLRMMCGAMLNFDLWVGLESLRNIAK